MIRLREDFDETLFVCFAAGGASFSAGQALAATISIGDVQDATIYQNNPNNSSGQGPGLFAGTNGADFSRHGLLQFNIAGNVPSGATITGVQLTLVLGQIAGSGGGGSGGTSTSTIEVHDVTASWGEPGPQVAATNNLGGSGQGVAAETGDVTWAARFFNESPAQPWTTPGGDFATAASASVSVTGAVGTSYNWSSAAMISDVQGWLNNPATDFGWALVNADEVDATDFRAFYSQRTDSVIPSPADDYLYTGPRTGNNGDAGDWWLCAVRGKPAAPASADQPNIDRLCPSGTAVQH